MDLPPILPVTPAPTPAPAPVGPAKRHGCLLTWLILMLAGDVIGLLGSVVGPVLDQALQQAESSNHALQGVASIHVAPPWVNLATIVLCLVDIAAVIFIFRWKKIGFFVSVAASALLIIINLAGGGSIGDVIFYPVSPVLLYLTLKMGGENCGWKRLK